MRLTRRYGTPGDTALARFELAVGQQLAQSGEFAEPDRWIEAAEWKVLPGSSDRNPTEVREPPWAAGSKSHRCRIAAPCGAIHEGEFEVIVDQGGTDDQFAIEVENRTDPEDGCGDAETKRSVDLAKDQPADAYKQGECGVQVPDPPVVLVSVNQRPTVRHRPIVPTGGRCTHQRRPSPTYRPDTDPA